MCLGLGLTASTILKVIGYAAFFALTIWQHRNNRAIVLGVVTVMVFLGFLSYAMLASNPGTPTWMTSTLFSVVVVAGVGVVGFVVGDAIRWFRERSKATVGPTHGAVTNETQK